MHLENLGEVIAVRELSFIDGQGSKTTVKVSIGKPLPFRDEEGYYCPFQIQGIGSEKVKYAAGSDAIQTLQLVMTMIRVTLQFMANEANGEIEWEGSHGGVGFQALAENEETRTSNAKANQAHKRGKKFDAAIVLVIVVLYAGVIAVAIWHPGLHERVKFTTENGLTLAIVIAVIAQVVIYREQWHVMKDQWKAMREQREVMFDSVNEQRKLVAQNERAVKAAEDNAKTAQDAFYVGEAPYFGVANLVFNDFATGYAPTLTITFVNGGKTPAWLFYPAPVLIYGDLPSSEEHWRCFPQRHSLEYSFIPAGEPRVITFVQNEFRLSEERLQALRGTQKFLFVVITLTYRDFRKRDHKRVLQYMWNAENGCFMDFESTKDTPPD